MEKWFIMRQTGDDSRKGTQFDGFMGRMQA